MPHMLAAEHMGIVQALQYGAARNDATLSAAVAAIGSQVKRLVLTFDGDGLWTFTSAWSIPANIVFEVPPGVKVTGAGNATINGIFVSYDPDWYTGTGTVTFPSSSAFAYFNKLIATQIGLNTNAPLTQLHLSGDSTLPAAITLEERSGGGGGAIVNYRTGGTNRASVGFAAGSTNYQINLAGGVKCVIAGAGANQVGIGETNPTHLLQLGLDDAWKPGTTTWTVISDTRTKEEDSAFTDGLNVVRAARPIRFRYNGKGGTPTTDALQIGFVAQELEQVAPYMVIHAPGKLEESDAEETDLLGYQGHALPLVLLNAIKEQQAMIEALTARLDALEAATPEETPQPSAAKKRAH